MQNLVLICDGIIQSEQKPIWERDEVSCKERNPIPTPLNLAELYTTQFRRLLLGRKGDRVTGYLDIAGDFFEGDAAFKEPMTVWQSIGENTTEIIPKKHDPSKQVWREFSSLFFVGIAKSSNQQAGVIEWYKAVINQRKKHITTSIVSLVYDEGQKSSLPVINVFSDSLTMHSSLLLELGANWRNTIELEISNCSKAANAISNLSTNLYISSGGEKCPKKGKEKDRYKAKVMVPPIEQLYYRLDLPFREWLRTIDPENGDGKQKFEKQKEWQETVRKTALAYARELVSQAPETALVGHKTEGRLYSAPRAMIIFKSELNKIYPKE